MVATTKTITPIVTPAMAPDERGMVKLMLVVGGGAAVAG